MIIYHDIFNDDEILTDSYKYEVEDDFCYVFEAKSTTKKGTEITDAMIGGNASAEDAPDALDDPTAETGLDVILNNNLYLNENFGEKKAFRALMKSLIGKMKSKLEPEYFQGVFKSNMEKFVKKMTPEIEEYSIYFGETGQYIAKEDLVAVSACPIFVRYDDSGCSAKVYMLKDFVYEEKA